MRVLMQQFSIRPGRVLPPGLSIDLPEELARELIENERAIQVFEDPPQTTTVQTAALSATDHQRKTIQRPRKRNTNA